MTLEAAPTQQSLRLDCGGSNDIATGKAAYSSVQAEKQEPVQVSRQIYTAIVTEAVAGGLTDAQREHTLVMSLSDPMSEFE